MTNIPRPGKHLFMVRPHLRDLQPVTLAPQYALRTYRPGDEIQWLEIIRESYGGSWPQDAFERCIASDDAFRSERLLFIVTDWLLVATVGAFQKLAHGDQTGYIHMMAVRPAYQRQGLGAALLRQCLLYFREEGWKDAVLDTDTTRLQAIRLYLAHGFLPFPEIPAEMDYWREVLGTLGREDFIEKLRLGAVPEGCE